LKLQNVNIRISGNFFVVESAQEEDQELHKMRNYLRKGLVGNV